MPIYLLEDALSNLLDINKLENGFVNIKIGELTQDIIDLLGINIKPRSIILWEDRFVYIHKHVKDFSGGKTQFDECMSRIPLIISKPDYVALHPTKGSIEFIKRVDELMIVVVRLKQSGNLAFRTAYPITELQLKDYIQCGTAVKL